MKFFCSSLRFAQSVIIAATFAAAIVAPASADGIPHAGDVAPAFSASAIKGGTLSLAQYRGKPVYLNFFASWCGPCNDEASSVGGFYKRYHARGLNIIAINYLENKDSATDFAKKYKWTFPVVLDKDGSIGHAYGALGLPVHVFIDKHGKISTFRLGQMDPSEIEAAIKGIL